MADELNAVVQRMIDAGESEENIGTVIQHYKPAYTPDPTMQAATQRAVARAQGALVPPQKHTDELGNEVGGMTPGPVKNFIGNVVNNPIAQGAAHPSTVGDLSSMLLPSGFGGAMRGAKDTAVAAGEGLSRIQLHPSALLDFKLTQPLKGLKDLVSIGPKPNPALPLAQDLGPGAQVLHGAEQFREPYAVPSERVPPLTSSASAPTNSGLSAADRASLVKQGLPPEAIAKIEAQIAPVASHVQPPALTPITPVASHPPTGTPPVSDTRMSELMQQFGGHQHPLTGPRVDVGAEVVGRQSGLSKQAVREATGPILGEAPGEASHVLPEKPLQRIIDTMKALPKEGTERTAYVQAAKDPKTMAQLENLRRTLKHLGLVIPAAVGARQALLGQVDAP